MPQVSDVRTTIAAITVGVTRTAQEQGLAKLTPLHRQVVRGMPSAPEQEIRVIFATLLPGDVTPHHTHHHPVTVYMLEGTFTLDLNGSGRVSVSAGEVFVEPPATPMTGRNLGDIPARMALFYVCDPDTPFADPVEAE